MQETESNLDAERLANLEQENAKLRQELKTLTEEIYPYRLYVEARNKLSALIVGLITVLGLFGLISIKTLVTEIRNDIKEKEMANIGQDVRKSLINDEDFRSQISTDTREAIKQEVLQDQDFKTRVVVGVADALKQDSGFQDAVAKAASDNPILQSMIDQSVRGSLLPVAKEVQQADTTANASQFAQALTQSYAEKRYFVIAASSNKINDVKNELSRVQKLGSDQFAQQFPDVKVCSPKPGNRRYALVVGSNLTFSQAEALKKKAIANKFQSDTYILPEDKTFFGCA